MKVGWREGVLFLCPKATRTKQVGKWDELKAGRTMVVVWEEGDVLEETPSVCRLTDKD